MRLPWVWGQDCGCLIESVRGTCDTGVMSDSRCQFHSLRLRSGAGFSTSHGSGVGLRAGASDLRVAHLQRRLARLQRRLVTLLCLLLICVFAGGGVVRAQVKLQNPEKGKLQLKLQGQVRSQSGSGMQNSAENRALLEDWNEAAKHVVDGAAWEEISAEVSAALLKAGETRDSDLITSYLHGIEAAAVQVRTLPENRVGVSADDLIALLIESHVLNAPKSDKLNQPQRDKRIIQHPLLAITRGGSYELIWDRYFAQQEFAATDPAIRAYKRGSEMIDPLIGALNDMTVSRCAYLQTSASRPSFVLRRCDLAMALLEAITHCKFFTSRPPSANWYSELSDEARLELIDSVKVWREATRDLDRVGSMEWWFERATFAQAQPMVYALWSEGERVRALSQLRRYLDDENDRTRTAVVTHLVRLGDRSGIEYLAKRLFETRRLKQTELSPLIQHGSRDDFLKIHEVVVDDIASGGNRNSISRMVLEAISKSDNLWSVPVLMAYLDVDDDMKRTVSLNFRASAVESRADLAAMLLQRITGQDFRFELDASIALRGKAIGRIREWWDREGRGVYGFFGLRSEHGGVHP